MFFSLCLLFIFGDLLAFSSVVVNESSRSKEVTILVFMKFLYSAVCCINAKTVLIILYVFKLSFLLFRTFRLLPYLWKNTRYNQVLNCNKRSKPPESLTKGLKKSPHIFKHQNYHPSSNNTWVIGNSLKWQPSWTPSWISRNAQGCTECTWQILKE